MPATFQQLLEPQQFGAIPFYAGVTIAVTLLAWGVGGIIGGILADYIGRKRTLLYAIFAYSFTTGFTGLAWNWTSFLILRFVVGLALGSEWGTGTAMMAEMWPAKHRGKGAGLMQCGLGIGFFIASLMALGALFGALNTMYGAISARTREIVGPQPDQAAPGDIVVPAGAQRCRRRRLR